MTIERIQRLKPLLRASGADYVALVPGPDLTYFAGLHMHLSERPIVALIPASSDNGRPPILIAPFFEVGKATSGPVKLDWKVHSYRDGVPYQTAFDEAAQAHGLRDVIIGVEPTQMRVLEWALLSQAIPGARQVSAADAIAELRMRKDSAEIAAMKRAIQLSEEALSKTLEEVVPGMTERQAASILMNYLLAAGADNLAFSPLVQTGPSGANPHAGAGDRVLRQGDTLIIDFGMTLDDYSSDITRTIAVGGLDEEMQRVYEAVKAANAAGRVAAKPGVTCEAVDKAARDVIEAAGYGQYFTHRTGHGLGLEGHEPPYIVGGNTLALQPGMTFTIEPGIYIPGKGGVRIEDNVVITDTGCESLTTFTRDVVTV
jgi:Xaa-Pro dipeptidase